MINKNAMFLVTKRRTGFSLHFTLSFYFFSWGHLAALPGHRVGFDSLLMMTGWRGEIFLGLVWW